MRISVVIPVLNGGPKFGRCLGALWENKYGDWECVVVDDGSTDGSANLAREYGAIVVSTERPQSGPAIARNLGAQIATGEVLFFIDADVLVKPDTLEQIGSVMALTDPPAACFGSYDDAPTEPNFLSQYRNLLHHFTHQQANREAETFWSGCGAIRRNIFLEMGGFSTTYIRPSIEDIELGYRLRQKGYRILLEKELQVTHMKRWTAVNLLLTDIRDRAIPWGQLILSQDALVNDLNLSTRQRISSAVSFFVLLMFIGSFLSPQMVGLAGLGLLVLALLNAEFYKFLAKKRGIAFALLAMPWHWLYFIYSGLSFGLCLLWYLKEKSLAGLLKNSNTAISK